MKKEFDELFKKYPVLEKINDKNDKVIESYGIIKKLEADSFMSSVNGTCQGVMFVLRGEMKIQKLTEDGDEMNLFDLLPGDLCHEAFSCLLHYTSMNITGKALQDSVVVMIPADVITVYCLSDAEFVSSMYQDLYKKFNQVVNSKAEKVHESLDRRLIKYLNRQSSAHIYKTHKEIAFEIDASRESVSRKLKQYEKQGFLTMERGCIHLQHDLNEILKDFF